MAKGEGQESYDVDGNLYTESLNDYNALIHGHAYLAIVEAAAEEIRTKDPLPPLGKVSISWQS